MNDYKIYNINGNFWAIATEIKLFERWYRKKFKTVTKIESNYDLDKNGMYEPLELFKDVEALNNAELKEIDGETYKYVSFRNMLEEFNLELNEPIPLYGVIL